MRNRAGWSTRVGVCACALVLWSLSAVAAIPQKTEKPARAKVTTDDLIDECQKSLREENMVGMVWWIPVEFWELSAQQDGVPAEKAAETFGPLRDYLLVAVVVGKIGGFGSIAWVPGTELKANTVFRDATGAEYKPVPEVSAEAQMLASILRPVFTQAIGKMGENIELLFFPAKNNKGVLLVSPAAKGSFSIVFKNLLGVPESKYEWNLPLTAFLPPKFCPVDKASMKGNWAYCPWHGVALEAAATSPAKKD